jgi:hypothetical protein
MRVHDRDKSGRVELRESSVFDGQSDGVRCYSRAGQNDPKSHKQVGGARRSFCPQALSTTQSSVRRRTCVLRACLAVSCNPSASCGVGASGVGGYWCGDDLSEPHAYTAVSKTPPTPPRTSTFFTHGSEEWRYFAPRTLHRGAISPDDGVGDGRDDRDSKRGPRMRPGGCCRQARCRHVVYESVEAVNHVMM